MRVRLNSINYETLGSVQQFKLEAFAPVVRQSGEQRLESLLPRSSFVWPPPTHGVGLPQLLADDIDDPSRTKRTKVAKMDTRFIPPTLPRLHEDSTEPTESGDTIYAGPQPSVEFKGALWGLFEGKVDATGRGRIYARKYTASSTSWTGGGTVYSSSTAPVVALDLAVIGNYIVALFVDGDDHLVYRSTDGISWSASSTQITGNLLVDTVVEGETIRAGKLVSFTGSTIYAFIWDEDSQTVDVFKSTNSADDWASDLADAVFSGSGILGRAMYFDLNGDVAPCFATAEAVWAYDTSTQTIQALVPMSSSANNALAMTVWENPFRNGIASIYVSLADGTYLEITLINSTNTLTVNKSGPNIDGGLDSDMEGFGTWMVPAFGWLFVASGGSNANQKATIWATDGRGFVDPENPGSGWHFMRQHGTANEEIPWIAVSNRDDETMRLHYQARDDATTSAPTVQASAIVSTGSGVSSTSDAFTCGGSNRMLIVFVITNDDSSNTPSDVTYNGVSMTRQDTQNQSTTVGTANIHTYALVAPASGSNTLAVTWPAPQTHVAVIAICVQDAEQSLTGITYAETSSAGATTLSVSPGSVTGALLLSGLFTESGNSAAPGTNETELQEGGSNSDIHHAAYSQNGDDGLVMAPSWSSSVECILVAVGVPPVPPASGDTIFIQNPLSHPLSSDTIKYQASGVMDRPRFNAGMPRDDGAWISIYRQDDDLTAADETVNVDYGVNGATPSTDWGTFTSATNEIAVGSGAGVSGKSIQLRENYARGSTNTLTPKGGDMELMYVKKPLKLTADTDNSQTLDGFRFVVDVKKTASRERITEEDVVKNLQTAEASVVNVTFSTGRIATVASPRYVRTALAAYIHDDMSTVDEYSDTPTSVSQVTVTCTEVVV